MTKLEVTDADVLLPELAERIADSVNSRLREVVM